MFTEKEIAYLHHQRLARIATVSASGQPDVAPVGYNFDGEYFYIPLTLASQSDPSCSCSAG